MAPSRRRDGGGDEILFAERARLRPLGFFRSRPRAEQLAKFLGLDLAALRRRADSIIIVVGSKGKGTAATFASATLAAAGLRVGTLTSPGLLTNRERIRVDGRAIAPDDYAALILRITRAMDAAQSTMPRDGYLAPTGLFTLAAVRHFLDAGCAAWVLEAGMGGASDEVSLFTPGVVALTQVFGEHLGVIGGSVLEIARDKLGVVRPETQTVVACAQPDPGARAAVAEVARRVRVVEAGSRRLPHREWPPSPIGDNARVGVAAGMALLAQRGITHPADAALEQVLDSVVLPARRSVHRAGEQTWVLDAAVTGDAATATLRWCTEAVGTPDTILVCIPDGKDRDGVLAAVGSRRCIALRSDAPHLSFASWPDPLPALDEVDTTALGRIVLAIGTVHFAGDVLELLGADAEQSFSPPSAGSS